MTETSNNIKVCVRVRSYNDREINSATKCIVSMDQNVIILTHPDTLNLSEEKQRRQLFTFDKCFWSSDAPQNYYNQSIHQQADIYSEVGDPVLQLSLIHI